LIKYIKSVLWRVAKRLSYIQDARCLKVNVEMLPTRSQTSNQDLSRERDKLEVTVYQPNVKN